MLREEVNAVAEEEKIIQEIGVEMDNMRLERDRIHYEMARGKEEGRAGELEVQKMERDLEPKVRAKEAAAKRLEEAKSRYEEATAKCEKQRGSRRDLQGKFEKLRDMREKDVREAEEEWQGAEEDVTEHTKIIHLLQLEGEERTRMAECNEMAIQLLQPQIKAFERTYFERLEALKRRRRAVWERQKRRKGFVSAEEFLREQEEEDGILGAGTSPSMQVA